MGYIGLGPPGTPNASVGHILGDLMLLAERISVELYDSLSTRQHEVVFNNV